MDKKIKTEFGEISYSVVRGKRRSISLKFHNSSTLIISIPRYSLVNVDGLIQKHMGWISKHAIEIANSRELIRDGSVLYGGNYYSMDFREKLGRPKVTRIENAMIVESENREAGLRAIANFMKKKTIEEVVPIAQQKLLDAGKAAKQIKFRRMRKWGYCTSSREIKFNAYLSMLPPEIVDYVVSHEVSHLSELNHSGDFWKVVGGLCPNYKELRKQLRNYSATLDAS
ncbi:MAG: M48 family metallopeptidase [Candidatus Micrarchaeales archaeon]